MAFIGHHDHCWYAGNTLQWIYPKHLKNDSICLSKDGHKIILKSGSYYILNFSINLCTTLRDNRRIYISIQTKDVGQKVEQFAYYSPVICTDSMLTASAGGILIPAYGNSCDTELTFTLFSPDNVKVRDANISVIKL